MRNHPSVVGLSKWFIIATTASIWTSQTTSFIRPPAISRSSLLLRRRIIGIIHSGPTTTSRSSPNSGKGEDNKSSSSSSSSITTNKLQKDSTMILERIQQIQDIIGTDAGGRGMKSLIVQGDLELAARKFANSSKKGCILLLSGFPCCVKETPPTETDGPPGTVALARAAVALGYDQVVLVTDDCNRDVFAAALVGDEYLKPARLVSFPAEMNETKEAELRQLADKSDLIVACERAGPASDGNCYTMRGTNMQGLVAPLHLLVEYAKPKPFLAIGDGGNELGMGKVFPSIVENIPDGRKIGCVVAADHLVAASVSNWGGYALAAASALARAQQETNPDAAVEDWVSKCLPTEAQEIALLDRCVAAGCRDGVSGKMEATVDGMPLEVSMQCLRDIRQAALDGKR